MAFRSPLKIPPLFAFPLFLVPLPLSLSAPALPCVPLKQNTLDLKDDFIIIPHQIYSHFNLPQKLIVGLADSLRVLLLLRLLPLLFLLLPPLQLGFPLLIRFLFHFIKIYWEWSYFDLGQKFCV